VYGDPLGGVTWPLMRGDDPVLKKGVGVVPLPENRTLFVRSLGTAKPISSEYVDVAMLL
jgi:hypothetical protein